ncbi:TetR/AcrR family transcriptional regulator [Fodinicola feengrottensis]|uniref:TetR/AcrR family transcriptional regulator n=1 Tax=Fodinicola feengrottensis TaxID=435914 RepID=A0ABP4VCP9_9ACTN|nr:TetR/AcrR family transcriptional regulator [Fodinicola feengrottensis]
MPAKAEVELDMEQVEGGRWRIFGANVLPPILACALEAFEEQGYHATTVRDIARRVGVTVPALYYHYENKQALLVELLMGSMGGLLERCEAAVAEAGGEPVDQFSAIVECIVLYMASRGSQGLLDSEIRSLEPENRVRYIALRDRLETTLGEIIERGVAAGDFTTEFAEESRRMVLTACNAVARWYHLDGPVSPEEMARRYVSIALGAVGYRPRSRARKKS